MKVCIIDYGLGNLNSIFNIVRYLGGKPEIVSNPQKAIGFDKYILPGVGSFDKGVIGIKSLGWEDFLNKNIVSTNIPIMGICLGMQLMCVKSEEGELNGLGWFDATVKKFNLNSEFKIPHMGWNTITVVKDNNLLEISELERRYYFVHSYFVSCNDENDVLFKTNYGIDFVSGLKKNNIFGVQFHPEKSHKFGMELMNNFIKL